MTRDTASEPEHDVVRVQEQLLEMLRMAGKESPPPRRVSPEMVVVTAPLQSAEKTAKNAATLGKRCRKCGSEKPWGTSSWCPDCGYYPKAGFGGTGVVESEEEAAPSVLSVFPSWALPMAIGIVVIFCISIGSQFIFTAPLQRSILALYQLFFFAFCAIATHARAAYLAIQGGRGLVAFVNPCETWSLMLNKVPKTQLLILVFAWGLTGTLTSFFIGLDVDIIAEEIAREVRKNPKFTLRDLSGVISQVTRSAFKDHDVAGILTNVMEVTEQELGGGSANGEEDLAGAIGTFTEIVPEAKSGTSNNRNSTSPPERKSTPPLASNSNTPLVPPAPTEDAKETFDYWIYGYTTNPEGEIRSLLLASTGGTGPLRFAQKLGLEGLDSAQLKTISDQLKPFRSRSAALASPYGGKWVKPVVKCRVEHEGLNSESRPSNPKFQSIVLP